MSHCSKICLKTYTKNFFNLKKYEILMWSIYSGNLFHWNHSKYLTLSKCRCCFAVKFAIPTPAWPILCQAVTHDLTWTGLSAEEASRQIGMASFYSIAVTFWTLRVLFAFISESLISWPFSLWAWRHNFVIRKICSSPSEPKFSPHTERLSTLPSHILSSYFFCCWFFFGANP